MQMKNTARLLGACTLVFAALLASCGGGRDGGGDVLVWDQGNWQ